MSNIYFFIYFFSLESKCTYYKDFSYSIWSLFLIIYFLVDASHFHIYYISNCVVMCYSLAVFLDIINIHLSLFLSGYNLPVHNKCKVEYNLSDKDRFSCCGLNSAVIRGSYPPCYICEGFTPWICIVVYFVIKILGNKNV